MSVPLWECLASVDSASGRRRVAKFLDSGQFPHYKAIPGSNGMLIRIDADGTHTIGRFVGREFQAVES